MKLFCNSQITKIAYLISILLLFLVTSSLPLFKLQTQVQADDTITFTNFPLSNPPSSAYDVATGPDGNVWFTLGINGIGKITPEGTVTNFTVPNSTPLMITSGPDGNLWFTEDSQAQIGRITPSGVVTQFPLPSGTIVYGITSGPDGNVWFTAQGPSSSEIGRITPSGVISEYPIASGNSINFYSYNNITSGVDGDLWFSEMNGLGRINPDGNYLNELLIYPYQLNNDQNDGIPQALITGPNGNIWFSTNGGALWNVNPTTLQATELSGFSGVLAFTLGPDGNIWFSVPYEAFSTGQSYFGKITPAGLITTIPVPTSDVSPNSGPGYLTTGTDGNIWFGGDPNGIGRINISSTSATPTPTPTSTPTPTPTPTSIPPAQPKGDYVALGDSYSSGEGAPFPTYISGTDDEVDKCHRSVAAYPELLYYRYSAIYPNFIFAACSGAITRDFIESNHEYTVEPPQLTWLDTATKLVSLTIGGNNADFANVLQYCATNTQKSFPYIGFSSCESKYATIVNQDILKLSNPTTDDTKTFNDGNNSGNPTLAAILYDIGKRAPNAKKILVVGYPRLFPENPPPLCSSGFGNDVFARSDMLWINNEGKNLDDAIDQAVKNQNTRERGNRFVYVNIYKVFLNHELCTSDPDLNNGILDVTDPDIIKLKAWSFHPKVQGQQAIATYIENTYGAELK